MARRDIRGDVPKRFDLPAGVFQNDLTVNVAEGPIMADATQRYAVGQHDTRPWGEWLVIDVGPGFVHARRIARQSLS